MTAAVAVTAVVAFNITTGQLIDDNDDTAVGQIGQVRLPAPLRFFLLRKQPSTYLWRTQQRFHA